MGEFRDAMVGEMRLRGFAPRTQRTYSSWMSRLVLGAKVTADRITEQQARGFLSELSGRGLSASTINQAISAVRFFYNEVLRRKWDLEIHYQRAPQRVPVTLTPDEVSRLLAAVPNLRERTAMEIAYAAGLRLGEVLQSQADRYRQWSDDSACEPGKGEERPQRDAEPGPAGDAAVVLESLEAAGMAVSEPCWEGSAERDDHPAGRRAGEDAGTDRKAGELPFVAA